MAMEILLAFEPAVEEKSAISYGRLRGQSILPIEATHFQPHRRI
jgi:hypothetical protein